MLGLNWITEKHVDFEYKKYQLLDYFQKIDKAFSKPKLYPAYKDLTLQYKNLTGLRQMKEAMASAFTRELKKIDLKNLSLEYEKTIEDDQLMQEIDMILDFSLPKFEYYLEEGKSIYEMVKQQLQVYPIGIVPLYNKEGYLLLSAGKKKSARVFQYSVTLFEDADEKYQGVNTCFVSTYSISYSNTYEQIKKELIRQNPQLPNPATYVVETDLEFPEQETLLPVAKKALVKSMSVS